MPSPAGCARDAPVLRDSGACVVEGGLEREHHERAVAQRWPTASVAELLGMRLKTPSALPAKSRALPRTTYRVAVSQIVTTRPDGIEDQICVERDGALVDALVGPLHEDGHRTR